VSPASRRRRAIARRKLASTDNFGFSSISRGLGKNCAFGLKRSDGLSILNVSHAMTLDSREKNAMSTQTKVKDVLTTGEVAKICNVAPRTVSKWFDSGALHGYRIPGSKDRRIPLNQLIRFMKHHGMPLNGLMTGCTRVLIVDDEQDIVEVLEKILEDEAKYEVEVAKGGFAAGVTADKFRPHVILIDMHLRDIDGKEVAKAVKANPDLQLTKVIAMSGKMTEDELKGLLPQGFDGVLKKPFHVRQVIETIEDATAVVY
jgi:excisionase family DNA binding protein